MALCHRRHWPAITADALQPAHSRVRTKLSGLGEPSVDFRIGGPGEHWLHSIVQRFGIESPALTASLAIGGNTPEDACKTGRPNPSAVSTRARPCTQESRLTCLKPFDHVWCPCVGSFNQCQGFIENVMEKRTLYMPRKISGPSFLPSV